MIIAGRLDLEPNRFTPFVYDIEFTSVDFTGATMQAQVRLLPDTPGDPLVDLVAAAPGSEGVSFAVADGTTTVTLQIDEATMEALPAAEETGDEVELWWDLQITPSGGVKNVWLRGTFTIIPGVTQ